MPITDSDILIKYSVKTGSAGNSVAGTAAGSLGKYISTTTITSAQLNNLFDDISGAENAASTVDYRIIFFRNAHASLTAQGVKVYLSAEVAGGASIAIAIDNVAASVIGSASAQAEELATETTTPAANGGFSSPTTTGAALSLGDIAAGECRAVQIRRTAANTAAVDNDGVTLTWFFDTAA